MPSQEYYEIYDSHAHYDDSAFDAGRARLLGETLPINGVRCVINMGTRIRTCASSLGLAGHYPYFFAGVGVHPSEIDDELPDNWLDCLRAWLSEKEVVCIGEIGLDYHWKDNASRERQMEVFAAQLALANELGYPVCVHDREAHGDVMDLLRRYRPQGVVHCFSGSLEMAREVVGLGMYIGLGGAVTFKNARKLLDVAREIPLDRILLETDAPYMAPEPYRGKRNDSTHIPLVAEKIAQLRGITAREVMEASNGNIRRLFRLDGLLRKPADPAPSIY